MGWKLEFDPAAVKELSKLDPQVARRILLFCRNESLNWMILDPLEKD